MSDGDRPHIAMPLQARKSCACNVLRDFLHQNSIVPNLTALCDPDHTRITRLIA
jgi:hypothetical protein